jgi:urease accessory protein
MNAFVDGLAQFFVPTHLLAVVAIGLLAGQGTRGMVVLLALFALGLLAGSFAIALAMREMPSALTLLGIAASAGIVAAAAVPLPSILKNALTLTTGTALAFNSPPQAITIPSAIATQAGFAGAALTTFGLIAFIATRADHPWQRVAMRVVASWIAASAILVLALRLTR